MRKNGEKKRQGKNGWVERERVVEDRAGACEAGVEGVGVVLPPEGDEAVAPFRDGVAPRGAEPPGEQPEELAPRDRADVQAVEPVGDRLGADGVAVAVDKEPSGGADLLGGKVHVNFRSSSLRSSVQRDDDRPGAAVVAVLVQVDPLPGPEVEPPVADRDRQADAKHRALGVRRHVVLALHVVAVLPRAVRDELGRDRLHVCTDRCG